MVFSLLQKHPKGFSAVFTAQVLFNFGFFGLKSLFVLYVLERFAFKEADAFEIFATLMALSYAATLLGGFLADKYIGPKNALLLGGALSVAGVGLLAFPEKDAAFLGMALLSLGSGCFKPSFSTLLSFLFKDPQDPRKDEAFTHLYMAMNVGNFTGPLICGLLSRHYGWTGGLAAAGLSFLAGSCLFWAQTRSLKTGVKTKRFLHPLQVASILAFSVLAGYGVFTYSAYFHGLMGAAVLVSLVCFCALFYKSSRKDRDGLLKTLPYIFLFAFFCSLFEQTGSSLMVFFDRAVDRKIMGFTIPSASLLSLNPVFILMLGTVVPYVSRRFLERERPLDGLTKFGIGFFFISLSFAILALSASRSPVPLSWVIAAIFVQAMGELFIVPVGFASISKFAPQRRLGFMMSLWLMAIAYGHYFAGVMARLWLGAADCGLEGGLGGYRGFFFKLSVMPFVAAVLLMLYAWRKYRRRGASA